MDISDKIRGYAPFPRIFENGNLWVKADFDDGKNGILFKSNDKTSLLNALLKFEKMDSKAINKKLLNCKKGIKVFTYFNHFKSLEKILEY